MILVRRVITIASVSLMVQMPQTASADGESQMILVPSDQLSAYWVLSESQAAEYPKKAMRSNTQGCVAIGFVIGSDGTTSNYRSIAFAPSEVFTESAIEATSSHRYRPAEGNQAKQPVFTYRVFTYRFQLDTGENDEAKRKLLGEVCESAAQEFFQNLAAGTQGAK